MNKKQYFKIIHWTFTIFVIVYILTGFGITEYQIIESITFGTLSKPLAFQLHTFLIYPFIILLSLHILLSINNKIKWKSKKNEKWRINRNRRSKKRTNKKNNDMDICPIYLCNACFTINNPTKFLLISRLKSLR